jgi:hypothetical protein
VACACQTGGGGGAAGPEFGTLAMAVSCWKSLWRS